MSRGAAVMIGVIRGGRRVRRGPRGYRAHRRDRHGLALAKQPGFDLPVRRPFFETLVQLILGPGDIVVSLGPAAAVGPLT